MSGTVLTFSVSMPKLQFAEQETVKNNVTTYTLAARSTRLCLDEAWWFVCRWPQSQWPHSWEGEKKPHIDWNHQTGKRDRGAVTSVWWSEWNECIAVVSADGAGAAGWSFIHRQYQQDQNGENLWTHQFLTHRADRTSNQKLLKKN